MINSIKNQFFDSISLTLPTPQSNTDSGVPILHQSPNKSPWLLQINDLIHQDSLPSVSETPISIFRLPESLHDGDATAYLPSHVALGPYHHFRPELGKMNMFKLGKAKNLKWGPEIHKLADQLRQLDLKIRACFDRDLEVNGETLSWVLLIDGLFLIDLLQNKYTNRPLKFPIHIFYGRLWSEVEIVSDMVKLENQIPLFVLKQICPQENPIDFLVSLLYKFSASVSPFPLPCVQYELNSIIDLPPILPELFDQLHHLLHFLYNSVLLIPNEIPSLSSRMGMSREGRSSSSPPPSSPPPSSSEFMTECFNILGSVINLAFIQQIKDTFVFIQRVFRLVGFVAKTNLAEKNTPLVIPSASDLKTAGVTFKSTKNGILKSNFDATTLTLTLPCIHLDGFSQVLLKNLVAFEAMAELNPPCLVNYIAVMNGLLRSSKDMKILEKAEIVHNHLNNEKEGVMLFNGVVNSTSSFKKESVLKIHVKSGMDNVEISDSDFIKNVKRSYENGLGVMVEKINKFYANCWRMKMKKVMSVVFKCLVILVLVILIVLVIARFVCKFFTCPAGIFQTTIVLHQMY